jgi:negative regulator of flagellin synthesis FlgM
MERFTVRWVVDGGRARRLVDIHHVQGTLWTLLQHSLRRSVHGGGRRKPSSHIRFLESAMTAPRKHRLNRAVVFRYDSRHEDGNMPSSLERTNRQVGSADMEVQGPGSVQRPNSVPRSLSTGSAKAVRPADSAAVPTPKDAVEISSAGQLLDKLSKSPEVRAERLAQIKADIASGKYDTDEKLEAAMMNLLQSMMSNGRDD